MKNQFTLIVLAALALAYSATSYAAPIPASSTSNVVALPPDSLPITSLAELSGWAKDHVAAGNKGLNQAYILRDGNTKTNIYANGNVDEVLEKLGEELFRFRTFNLNDQITFWTFLTDDQGYILYWGYGVSPGIYKPLGSADFSFYNDTVEMSLSDVIQIPVPGVINARVQYTDANGNRWEDWLNVNNGRIAFRSNLAAKFSDPNGSLRDGTLIADLYFPNGGPGINPGDVVSYAYSFTTGRQRASWTVRGGYPTEIKNYISATDAGIPAGTSFEVKMYNVEIPTTQQENGSIVTPPTMTIESGSERDVLVNVFLNGEIEKPNLVECLYRLSSQPTDQQQSKPVSVTNVTIGTLKTTTISVSVHVKPGRNTVSFVIPEFESASKAVPSWWFYNYGGGSTGGGAG